MFYLITPTVRIKGLHQYKSDENSNLSLKQDFSKNPVVESNQINDNIETLVIKNLHLESELKCNQTAVDTLAPNPCRFCTSEPTRESEMLSFSENAP